MKSYLTYCEDQKDIALAIERNLRIAGAEFTHDTRDEEEQNRMKREMRLTQDPVFLLVSDGFLKSQQCMRGALAFITDMGITRNIRPVITNANVNQPDTYSEYWKSKYEELRSQKHDIPQHEQEAYNWQVMIMRRISNEIAPFIEEVNKRNPVTYEQFQADNFHTFYTAHGREPDESQGLISEHDDSPTDEIISEEKEKSSMIPPVIPAVLPFSKSKNEPAGIIEDGLETELEQIEDLTESVVDEGIITENESKLDLFDESSGDFVEEAIVTEDELKSFPDEINETPAADIFEEEITTEDELKLFEGEIDETPTQEIFEEEIIENTPANKSETTTFAHQNNSPEIELNDTEEEITWADADTAAATGNYDVARMHYEALLEKTPYHAEGHYQYGLLLLNQFDEKDAAIEQFEVAVEQKNKYTEAWLELAHLAEKEEDYLLTKSYYEKIVSYEDDNAEAHYRLGNVLSRYFDDQPQQAAHHYQKAIDLDPDHNDARYEYATLLSAHFAGDDEAREQLEAVIANDPEHPFAYYDLAVINRKAGRKTRAYKQYKRATEINSMFKTDKNDQLFKKPKKKKKKADCSKKADPKKYKELIEKHEVAPISTVQTTQAKPESTPQYTVLITGGTSGIGKATAELFARNGHRVIVTGRRADRLTNLKEDLENQYDTNIKTLEFDVRDHQAVTTATKQLTDEWQDIDILINNAGLALGRSSIHEGNIEDWETMIDTNVKGLLYMTRAIAPRMAERGMGHIINISSISGKEVYPGGAVYCATKHAVDAITRGARMDLVKHGIRVSSISPGHVLTEFADVRYKGDRDRVEEGYAGFDPLKADDIADVVYYVATRPESVNIQDVYMFSKQQASAMVVDRSGKTS